MTFDLVEKHQSPNDYPIWYPFAESDDFNERWWGQKHTTEDGFTYLEIRLAKAEVARVELDNHVGWQGYIGAPQLGNVGLEIQFIEVARPHRGRGIGTAVVQALGAMYRDRVLVAFSEDADDFWASLGWARYEHDTRPHLQRPLFIQAADGQAAQSGAG